MKHCFLASVVTVSFTLLKVGVTDKFGASHIAIKIRNKQDG